MRCVEVTKEDCKQIASLINLLHGGRFEMNGKEMCANADTLRWLQAFALDAAKAYQAADVAPSAEPTSELKVKHFSPGKGK